MLRYDPMSMRPFMSYPEADYAAHWLEVIGRAKTKPIFAHVNWFQRGEDGRFLWPGYRDNLRPLLWLMQLRNGEVTGRQTPVGIVPTEEELQLEGMEDLRPDDLQTILSIDVPRWQQEMVHREQHLSLFRDLPEEIWAAHRRVSEALDAEAK